MRRAEGLVQDLFEHFLQHPASMQQRWAAASAGCDDAGRFALIGDYVAGMTDRYAIEAHQRLFDHTPVLL